MAINRIAAPLATSPATFATPVVNQLASNILDHELPERIIGTNVVEGARFNIGGVEYVADADTAITGTASDYVKITPSGDTASAAYVADLTGVTWNPSYKGYYDTSGNLYVFDEVKAMAVGAITAMRKEYLGAKNLGAGWHGELLKPMSCINTHELVTFGLRNATYTAYNHPFSLSITPRDFTGGVWHNLFSLDFKSDGCAFNISKIAFTYTTNTPDSNSTIDLYDNDTATRIAGPWNEAATVTETATMDIDVGLTGPEIKHIIFRRYEYGSGDTRGPMTLAIDGSFCEGKAPGLIELIANSQGDVLTCAVITP